MSQQDSRTKKITVFFRGKHYGATELAKLYKVTPSTFRRRLKKGFSTEEALGL